MSSELDTLKLRKFYANLQCHGVVILIDYLESPDGEGVMEIGSGSIGLSEILKEIWIDKDAQMASAWFRTESLYIGSRDGSVTPLQWLKNLSEVFEKLSAPAQKRFDQICKEFAAISQLKPVGDVEIWTSHGIFVCPPDIYRKFHNLPREEQEKYRVPVSPLFSRGDDKLPKAPFDAPFKDDPSIH